MSSRSILLWPDKRLVQAAEPVDKITDEIRAIWDEMIEQMNSMPGNVGLAAPQLGINLALAIVDASDSRGQVIRLANPEIIASADKMQVHEEASPNLPGVSAKISRPEAVNVAFMDHYGMRVRQDFTGLWSTSVQHQIDHLAGRLFIDRLSRTKREMLLKKYQKGRS